LIVTPSYLGISHGKDPVIVQVTLNAGRTVEQKRAFYARLADDLQALGIRREDVIVGLVEVSKENWSFGNGEAQYAK
jgi:4-oxalocrotonate tautomerase